MVDLIAEESLNKAKKRKPSTYNRQLPQ